MKHQKPPLLEWIIGAIGLIFVAGAIGFLIYEEVTTDDKPPQMVFTIESIEIVGESYLVKFEVENTGDETASEVLIEGTLSNISETIETSEVTFAYLPPHSKRQGGLYFSQNPDQFTLTVIAKGYEKP